VGCQFCEDPGYRHLGGLIARHIQVKGIGGADESGQGLVAAIALQPESATEHQLDQRLPFPAAALSGPQFLAAHAGEPAAQL